MKSGANPLAMLNEGGTDGKNYYKFGGKAQLDLTPLKGLTLTAVFAPRYTFETGKKFTKAVNVYYEDGSSIAAQNLGASRNNYELDTYPYLNLGPEDYQYNSGSAGHNAYQSVFGRAMYSYKDRYMLQANVRADASSRFASDYRWGVFPSVSAGWVISSESWFPKDKQIDYLKVRASIGSLGNERISDAEFP